MPHSTVKEVQDSFKLYAFNLAKEKNIPAFALAITHPSNDMLCTQGVDTSTIFPIGSLSKSFAAALTALLVRDGLLAWDDPVIKHVADFKLADPQATAALTVRHILSHINPLYPKTLDLLIELDFPLAVLLRKLRQVPLNKKFNYSYQNVLFSLIKLIVEKVTGCSYEENLRKRILEPLSMEQTFLSEAEYKAHPNKAKPHSRSNNSNVELPGTNKIFTALPAMGMCMSINDLKSWLKHCTEHHDDLIKDTLQPAQDADPPYAMGWWQADEQGSVFCHDGMAVGFQSEMAIIPERKYGVAVLTNVSGTDFGVTLVNQFVQHTTKVAFSHMEMLFWSRDLPRAEISNKLIEGAYENELIGRFAIKVVTENRMQRLVISLSPTVFGILVPARYSCYSNDTRPEIIPLRGKPTFKIQWQGSVAAFGQTLHQNKDLLTAIQDHPTEPAKQLILFLMHASNRPTTAVRCTDISKNDTVQNKSGQSKERLSPSI